MRFSRDSQKNQRDKPQSKRNRQVFYNSQENDEHLVKSKIQESQLDKVNFMIRIIDKANKNNLLDEQESPDHRFANILKKEKHS